MKKKILFCLTVILFFMLGKNAFSWDDGVTHRDISKFASENSVLNQNKGDYLKKLGFDKGLDQIFTWNNKGQDVRKWLQDGAELEDAPAPFFPIYGTTRSFNHFHNPLKPWDQAGLNDTWTGKSSLLFGHKTETRVVF